MGIVALLLGIAGIVSLLTSTRGLAVLMFGAAAGFWLLPSLGGGGGGPAGFGMAAQPRPAPAAEFKTAGGKHLTLADFRGRVVLLNIWATWCGPCRSEMPSLDRLQALHRDDGLAVLTVSVDSEGFGAVRRFYAQSGIRNLGLYLDVDGATAHAFGTQSIPTTLLIDRDGKVVGSLVGAMEWDSPDALALIRHYLDS
ncbi:MAG TPA: TlpA disulfide reductase family protein [Candidatus Angelobacter sp.]|nr:TlpA disulfide reductase family protein [Candidatus Angelobacter sp.]